MFVLTVVVLALTFWPLVHTAYPMTLAPLDVPIGVNRGGFQWTCRIPGACPHWTFTSFGGRGGPAPTGTVSVYRLEWYIGTEST